MERIQFDIAYQRVLATGLPVRDPDEAGTRLTEYRSTYGTPFRR